MLGVPPTKLHSSSSDRWTDETKHKRSYFLVGFWWTLWHSALTLIHDYLVWHFTLTLYWMQWLKLWLHKESFQSIWHSKKISQKKPATLKSPHSPALFLGVWVNQDWRGKPTVSHLGCCLERGNSRSFQECFLSSFFLFFIINRQSPRCFTRLSVCSCSLKVHYAGSWAQFEDVHGIDEHLQENASSPNRKPEIHIINRGLSTARQHAFKLHAGQGHRNAVTWCLGGSAGNMAKLLVNSHNYSI